MMSHKISYMISYEEAIKKIKEVSTFLTPPMVKLDLLQSCGRVLAQDIISDENIPYAHNSSMDGFALNAEETRLASPENPLSFKVQTVLSAGDSMPIKIECDPRACFEIMTGALLPDETYDAVVKVEDISRNGNQITLTKALSKGENVRAKGTDFSKGQKILSQNTILKDQHIMALAALGVDRVVVKKKLRVAVISTGNEIVSFEQKTVKTSQVRNSSAPFLKVFLERHQCEVDLLGIHQDEAQSFFELMSDVLQKKYDFIITTGAVSMGKWDFIAKVLPDLKMKTLFHKVAIRPGKPILLAQSEDCKSIFFGLPGNPISTAVGARFFVLPLIEMLMQMESKENLLQLHADVIKPEGLECFFKAKIFKSQSIDKAPMVEALSGQASYMIHSFLQSDCWVQLPAAGSCIRAGTLVRVVDL